MLSRTVGTLGLTALGTASERGPASDPIRLAGDALDRTLAAAGGTAYEAALLIIAGCTFEGPRREQRGIAALTPVLDNELGTSLARELLLRRGLVQVQPHGVLFAEQTPLLSALRVARLFMLAEGLRHVLWVSVDADAWRPSPAQADRRVTDRDGPARLDLGVVRGAAAGLLTTDAGRMMRLLTIRRMPLEAALEAFGEHRCPGGESSVIAGPDCEAVTRAHAPSVLANAGCGSVVESVQWLAAWARGANASTAPVAAVWEAEGPWREVASFEHPELRMGAATERSAGGSLEEAPCSEP